MTSKELITFEQIVEEYQKGIINFHYRLVGNRFDAEDLAQETFIKAYLKLDTLKEHKKLRSWLFSVARNVAIDFFRRHKEKHIVLDNDILQNIASQLTSVDFDQQINHLELNRELDKCMNSLASEDKQIIKLLYYEGFSYKEIGDILGMNVNTLKSRLHRARKVLLDALHANEYFKDVKLGFK